MKLVIGQTPEALDIYLGRDVVNLLVITLVAQEASTVALRRRVLNYQVFGHARVSLHLPHVEVALNLGTGGPRQDLGVGLRKWGLSNCT